MDRPVSPDLPIDVAVVGPTGSTSRDAIRKGYCMGVCFAPGCRWIGPKRPNETEARTDAERHYADEHETGP
jgi:hypothetical protein